MRILSKKTKYPDIIYQCRSCAMCYKRKTHYLTIRGFSYFEIMGLRATSAFLINAQLLWHQPRTLDKLPIPR